MGRVPYVGLFNTETLHGSLRFSTPNFVFNTAGAPAHATHIAIAIYLLSTSCSPKTELPS